MYALPEINPVAIPPETKQDFVDAMSCAANGVSVITTNGRAGRAGMTVSSMVSVSADPPLLLVCINSDSARHDVFRENGSFAVNVLASNQQCISDDFSGRSRRGTNYVFAPQDWARGNLGHPVLRAASAVFECDIVQRVSAGTHTIFIARALRSTANNVLPLVYANRSYARPAALRQPRYKLCT